MAVTFSLALFLVILAYLAQSPGTAAKLGLGNSRLELRLKTFTGYALALMMLSLGFFIAGVPLDATPAETAVAPTPTTIISEIDSEPETAVVPTEIVTVTASIDSASDNEIDLTPSSGAFGGPPPNSDQEDTKGEPQPEAEETPAATPLPADSASPVTFTPTPTASATPTSSATPTVTPTPIDGETAVLNLAGGVVWLYRSPGAQTLVVLQDEEIVILRDGYANRAGIIWREVNTGDGTIGWVEESFLQFPEDE